MLRKLHCLLVFSFPCIYVWGGEEGFGQNICHTASSTHPMLEKATFTRINLCFEKYNTDDWWSVILQIQVTQPIFAGHFLQHFFNRTSTLSAALFLPSLCVSIRKNNQEIHTRNKTARIQKLHIYWSAKNKQNIH